MICDGKILGADKNQALLADRVVDERMESESCTSDRPGAWLPR